MCGIRGWVIGKETVWSGQEVRRNRKGTVCGNVSRIVYGVVCVCVESEVG